jgi:ABC-2 type transport system ATP-binding protein
MPAHVVVQDLQKRYGGVEAVRGVSFEIQPGEIFGLLGPNGAGKTTTVECLVGLRDPDAGALMIGGIDARRDPRAVKQKIGVALQTTALQDKITPREALRLFGALYAQRFEPAALLERFSLTEKADARYDTLSGGQRQRLALALAFVNRPELVVLDEPTAGLDPQSRRELRAKIAQMKQEGHTVLLTTHYLEEAEQLCDRIAIIDRGQIVAIGAPRALVGQLNAAQSVTLLTAKQVAASRLAALPDIENLEIDGHVARFRTTNAGAMLAALTRLLDAEQTQIVDLHVRKGTLEDVFLRLTSEQAEHEA